MCGERVGTDEQSKENQRVWGEVGQKIAELERSGNASQKWIHSGI
jgi:hypothetical protein